MDRRTLQWLEISNYRNLKNQKITLGSLSILIGPNGAGKSNFLNLLLFLKDCLIDNEQGVTRFQKALHQLGYRIANATLPFPAKIGFKLGISHPTYTPYNDVTYFDLGLLVRNKDSIIIDHEVLASLETKSSKPPYFFYKFHEKSHGSGVYSRITNSRSDTLTKFVNISDVPQDELMLADIERLLDTSQFSPEKTPLYVERRQLVDYIRQWQFYNSNNMNMELIRNEKPSPRISKRFLDSNGRNLKSVIFNLERESLKFIDIINQEMKEILPFIQKIRSTTDGDVVKIECYWQGIEQPFDLENLSDGTVRMLCWAVILLSPFPPPLLVIEEPEIGLHPAWFGRLAQWIKQASLKSQIIISTHSSDFLDKFNDIPESVYVFNTDKSGTNAITQVDSQRLAAWLDDGYELGDLYRIGEPALGGWPW